MTPVFVGRTRETAQLDAHIERARRGDAQSVVVTGEAGTGKTSLLAHTIERATDAGFRTVAVLTGSTDGAAPLAALQSVLLPLLAAEEDPLARRLEAVLRPGGNGRQGTRWTDCAMALRDLLEMWAARTAVLFAVDDLHAVDAATASVVHYLMGRLRPGGALVVAYREEALELSRADAIRRIVDEGRAEEICLGDFDVTELAALVEARTGHVPDESFVAMLHDRSGGLPFFAVELLQALLVVGIDVSSPLAAARAARLALPRRVSTAVLHRVFEVGPDARLMASAIAVLGTLSLDQLPIVSALTAFAPTRTNVAFDDLVRARVLVEDRERYRFPHSIVRDALYADLDPARRRIWHQQVAMMLAQRRSAGRPNEIVEIGEHLRQGPGGRSSTVAALLHEVGDAVVQTDPGAAVDWYRDALVRLAPDDPTTAGVQLALARALDLDGHHAAAERTTAAAMRSLPAGPGRERGAIIAAHAAFAGGSLDRATRVLDAAIAAEPNPSARLLLQRAELQFWHGHLAESEHDLATARTSGLDGRSAAADVLEMHLAFNRGRARHGLALAERLRIQLDDLSSAAQTNVRAALRTVAVVNLDPAIALADADSIGTGARSAWQLAVTASALLRQGRLLEAVSAAARAVQLVGDEGADLLNGPIVAAQIQAFAELGDLEQAAQAHERARTMPLYAFSVYVDCAVARLHAFAGDPGRAISTLRRAAHEEAATGRINMQSMALAALVDSASSAHDAIEARAANAQLQALPDEGVTIATTMWRLMSQAFAEDDAGAADQARQLALRHGLALDAARALAAAGAIRTDRGLLATAHDEFDALGARSRQREVAVLLDRPDHHGAGARREGHVLSASDLRIARLVADGLTNREVAREMNLSPKTIEVYLSRIYAKTKRRSRVELAVAVHSGELSAPGDVPSAP